jgi:hypothetical protein
VAVLPARLVPPVRQAWQDQQVRQARQARQVRLAQQARQVKQARLAQQVRQVRPARQAQAAPLKLLILPMCQVINKVIW